MQHKVSLYTDDFLLFVSNPHDSLCSALSLLNSFSQLLGYKITFEKSELFPIGRNAEVLDLADLLFKIVNHKLSYLGISVTRKHKDLFKENFLNLINRIKQTLTQWSPITMSLVDLINSVKITILPKFSFRPYQC